MTVLLEYIDFKKFTNLNTSLDNGNSTVEQYITFCCSSILQVLMI